MKKYKEMTIDDLISRFLKEQTNENFADLIDRLINEEVIILDRGLNSDLKKLNDEAITPLVITDSEKKNYIPIFTNDDHIGGDLKKLTKVNHLFKDLCNDSVVDNNYIEGYVLNPFSHGLKLPKEVIKIVIKYKEEDK
ncbi:MAG: SseB family protein [Acholeplasmatales bacterium]|nr:SseB family protein [Acholeplasmatales bacterium]